MNENEFWPSKLTGVEAWTSTWGGDPKSRHAHDGYQLSVTRSGCGLVRRGDRVHVCTPGDIVVFHPGEAHGLQPCGGDVWVFDTLYLPAASVPSSVPTEPVVFGSSLIADEPVNARITALHRSISEGSSGLKQGDALQDVLARLLEVAGVSLARPGVGRAALIRVKEFLADNIENPVTLADLAELAGVGGSI